MSESVITLPRRPGTFCWMDLKTRDMARTDAFFSAALGWRSAPDPDSWRKATVFEVGGHRIGGMSDLANPIYPPHMLAHIAYYLAVDDVDNRTEAAAQAGAELVLEPFDVAEEGRIATVIDPFGAPVSLWQAREFAGWTHPVDLPGAPRRMVHGSDRPAEARDFYRTRLGLLPDAADFVDAQAVPVWEAVLGVPDPSTLRITSSDGLSFLVDPLG